VKRMMMKACAALIGAAMLTSGISGAAAADSTEAKGTAVVKALTGIAEPWGLAKGTGSDMIVVSKGSSLVSRWSSAGLSAIGGQAGVGYNDGYAHVTAFNGPTYAAADSKGIIYVSDTENNVVRKITNGKVYTFAGNGEAGYVDGPREKALFLAPGGLAVDADDNVYVADTLNHVIRKITPAGDVSTFAGAASEEFGGYKDGMLSEAKFNEPMGLAFDDEGRLFVADSGNHLIRVISGGKVDTYAGKPTAADPLTGYMAGGYVNGNADNARFSRPRDIAYEAGVLFVADSLNHRIRAVLENGKVISIAGEGTPGDAVGGLAEARFNEPSVLLYSSGKLFVSDTGNDAVKAMDVFPGALQPILTEEDIVAATDLLPPAKAVQGWLDGGQIPFNEAKQPYRSGDHLYIPSRPLFEAWGADIEWNAERREAVVTKGDWTFTFAVDGERSVVLSKWTMYADLELLKGLGLFVSAYDEEYNAVIFVSEPQ